MAMIVINASELASVMGRHDYQPRDETMLKVWERIDRRTFCLANSLEHRSHISAIIEEYYEMVTIPTIKDYLQKILVDKWSENEDSFVQVMKEIFPRNDLIQRFAKLQFNIAKELKSLTLRNWREEKLLKGHQIHQSDLVQEVKKLTENENRSISESAKEFCDKKGIKDKEVVKAVESRFSKDRGTKLESKTVEVFGKEKGVEFSEAVDLYEMKIMECEGVVWALQGIADALTEDKVIEVKNRRNRFMQPIYDLIQLQAYLYLYDREKGILLERFNKENKETEVKFEVGFWIDDVIPEMKAFVEELQSTIDKSKQNFKDVLPKKSPCKRHIEDCDGSPIKEKVPCPSSMKQEIPALAVKESLIHTPIHIKD